SNLEHSLALGGILVAIVLVLLLGNVRTAFISLTAIPLSLLTAVIVLTRFGITINTITLGGLVIALGEVVDDSIIDVENIFRRLREHQAKHSSGAGFSPANPGVSPANLSSTSAPQTGGTPAPLKNAAAIFNVV